jgi:hypothetical protein
MLRKAFGRKMQVAMNILIPDIEIKKTPTESELSMRANSR